jgi:hypothetical protein
MDLLIHITPKALFTIYTKNFSNFFKETVHGFN